MLFDDLSFDLFLEFFNSFHSELIMAQCHHRHSIIVKVADSKVGISDLAIMRENSAEERDMIGGGVESCRAQAEDPAESDEERDIVNSIFLLF